MVRIWYIGEYHTDRRVPGVALSYGTPVDVPDDISSQMVDGKVWSYEKPKRQRFTEIRRPEWKSIEELPGVGGATAQKLRTFGISKVGDMANASDELLARISEQPGISEKAMRSLRDKAQAQI